MNDSAEMVVPAVQAPFQVPFQTAGTAMALLDAEGTVVGWMQDAQQLVGYAATEAVGRSVAFLFSGAEARAKVPALPLRSGVGGHWSGFAELLHRDGRSIDVGLCVQSLCGQGDRARWVISATDKAALPSWSADGPVVQSLQTSLHFHGRLPVGVAYRDTDLRCTWVNEAQDFKDGIPLQRRLGRTLTEAAPGAEAESLEALMRQVLESGVPVSNVEYRAFWRRSGAWNLR
jgi:PAS domain S-box-containing protein